MQKSAETENQFEQAKSFFDKGEFNKAELLIEILRNETITDSVFSSRLEILQAKIDRIRLDFSKSETEIREELTEWFPNLDSSVMAGWENSKKLEMRYIDGDKLYFRNAVSNLFRLDSLAKKIRNQDPDPLEQFCLNHTSNVILNSEIAEGNIPSPVRFRIDYTIKLNPDAVPEGETVRCWMPFPRNSLPRQKNIKLLNVNSEQFYIAPDSVLQRSLYLEKKAQKGMATVFSYSAEFETTPAYFTLERLDVRPYRTDSEIFRIFTAERPPQIVFSDEIRQLSQILTDGLTKPYDKVQGIFIWIDQNIPWASALEYSIMENIPQYVLENMHGDCGMKTLLFMSLARVAGIPCRWQSGWMLHPGEVNLHDWCEVYYEGIGWVPLDQSFGLQNADDENLKYFYSKGIDAYRLIINDDYGMPLDPPKKYFRSEPIDFQRGELEWNGGNLYFDKWEYNMMVTYL